MIYSVVPMHVCSVVVNCLQPYSLRPVRLLCPWGFCRQEYWSGLPFPPPGDLPNPGIKPLSPALLVDSLPLSHLGSPYRKWMHALDGGAW